MAKSTYKQTHRRVGADFYTGTKIDFGHSEKQEFVYKSISGPTTGTRRVFVKDGERTGDIELWINIPALVRLLGPDALRSKSRVAKRVNGLVQVRAVNVKETKV